RRQAVQKLLTGSLTRERFCPEQRGLAPRLSCPDTSSRCVESAPARGTPATVCGSTGETEPRPSCCFGATFRLRPSCQNSFAFDRTPSLRHRPTAKLLPLTEPDVAEPGEGLPKADSAMRDLSS